MTLAMMVAALGFVACGDDDDDDLDNGQGTNDKRLIRVKHVRRFRYYDFYNQYHDRTDSTMTQYIYDSNGRITRENHYRYKNIDHEPFMSGKTDYIYEDDLITTASGKCKYIIEDGKIVKIFYISDYGNIDASYYITYENGYMSKRVYEPFSDERSFTRICNWSDGLLESYEYYENNDLEYTVYFEYTKYKNMIVNAFIMDMILDVPFWDYMGKLPKYLISKRIIENEVTTYDWTVENGIPIKVAISENRYGVSESYTFEWE